MPPDTVLGKDHHGEQNRHLVPLCIHSRPNMDLGCISHASAQSCPPPPAIPARTLLLCLGPDPCFGCVVRNLCFAIAKGVARTRCCLLRS